MHRALISRRTAIIGLIASPALISRGIIASQSKPGQKAAEPSGEIPVRLIKEFKDSFLLDVSSDGAKLCFRFSKHPTRSFRETKGSWSESSAKPQEGEDAIRIIATDSWIEIASFTLVEGPIKALFFLEGERLYAETEPILSGQMVLIQRKVVDLKTGKQEIRLDPYIRDKFSESYWPTSGNMLLKTISSDVTYRPEELAKAELPTYKELGRSKYAESRLEPVGYREAPLTVCANRRTFAYGFDNTVVYRNTDDLRILWSHQTVPGVRLLHVAISADGGRVAVSANGKLGPRYGANPSYVSVLDGKDGDELIRLSEDTYEPIALSPDGKMIAVGKRIPLLRGKTHGTQPTVFLFDVQSGKRLATIVQDQFYEGGREFLYAGVSPTFTPDGKYLITSGRNAKIWDVGPLLQYASQADDAGK